MSSVSEYRVVITPWAAGQLREVVSYVQQTLAMPQASRKLFDELTQAILSLDHLPRRFQAVELGPRFDLELRRMRVRKYTVIYMVDEDSHEVDVLAIHYGMPSDEHILRALDSVQ